MSQTSAPPVTPSYSTGPYGLKIKKTPIPGVKQVIVIASGKGGVGKSTVSSNLAFALAAQGYATGLLDADIYGPSAPIMCGEHRVMAVDEHEKLLPARSNGISFASFGLLLGGKEAAIWRGPLLSKALLQLCYEVRWGSLDFLIIDLPPGTGDVQLTLLERLPIAAAVIVTTPQDVALIDAEKAYRMFKRLDTPVLGVVANMVGFTCSNCGKIEHIFGEEGARVFADHLQLPLLATLPLKSTIRLAADNGLAIAHADDAIANIFNHLARTISATFS